jgi:hypothetical protein
MGLDFGNVDVEADTELVMRILISACASTSGVGTTSEGCPFGEMQLFPLLERFGTHSYRVR